MCRCPQERGQVLREEQSSRQQAARPAGGELSHAPRQQPARCQRGHHRHHPTRPIAGVPRQVLQARDYQVIDGRVRRDREWHRVRSRIEGLAQTDAADLVEHDCLAVQVLTGTSQAFERAPGRGTQIHAEEPRHGQPEAGAKTPHRALRILRPTTARLRTVSPDKAAPMVSAGEL